MRRATILGPFVILTLLAAPLTIHAEERSDWRQPPIVPDAPASTIAEFDTASGQTFSATDAQGFMEQAGYAGITDLEQVNPFVWRASGRKDGNNYALTADFSGAVVGIDMPAP